MQMNPSIILAGQAPDIMGQYGQGMQMAQTQRDNQHTNAFRSMLQQQGPGIMQGQENALAALAQYDPQAALNAQSTQQGMRIAEEDLQMRRATAARQAREWAQQQDSATIAREREQLTQGLRGASWFYSQGDRAGYEQWVRSHGLDPAEYSFDLFPAISASVGGVIDGLGDQPAAVQELSWRASESGLQRGTPEYQAFIRNGGEPQAGQGFRRATPEEAAQYGAQAGQFGPDGRFYAQNPPSGMSIRTNPDGTMELVQGPGAGGRGGGFTEGQARDVVYSTRARGALERLEPVAEALMSRPEQAAGMVPMGLARGLQSPEFQQAQVAGDEFLQAILRKDTGAAITANEREEYGRVYLPQPGDTPQVLALRAEARRRALAALESGMSQAQIDAQTRALGAEIGSSTTQSQPQPQAAQQGPNVDMAPSIPRGAPQAEQSQGQQITAQQIMTMPESDLLRVDVMTLDADALRALEQRWSRINDQ